MAMNFAVPGVLAQDNWFYKRSFADYVPSGMPDFDQKQWGTYNWMYHDGTWSHCGPVAAANSLWWLDSEFEPIPIPPPAINDGYPLVRAYGQWDDHSPLNVQPLVEHLAFLMDTDGRRTGLLHSGTNVYDMEAGLTHYLSWSGVNPLGDVNGDGTVDQTDINIVINAMGTHPGQLGWDLRADVFPATMTYPPIADNMIDQNDLGLVGSNLGLTGSFYEHTVDRPDFYYIEEEVEKSQDVVLLLGYWYFNGFSWYREEPGHFVTVAGVDSQDLKIAISDPYFDAFEMGLTPQGRIPVPHGHIPPEPPYILHNDAQFVSQDAYDVMWLTPLLPPCPGGDWSLIKYPGAPPIPGFYTVIESAVITSPLRVHDVAVTNVKPAKTIIGQNYAGNLTVAVQNHGNFTETFNVTVYANTTVIATITNITLASGNSMISELTWNTTHFSYGNYTLSAVADTVQGECLTLDNTYNCSVPVHVGVPGDCSGPTQGVPDGMTNMRDINYMIGIFNTNPSLPTWNPNADVNNDGIVNMRDINIAIQYFNKHE